MKKIIIGDNSRAFLILLPILIGTEMIDSIPWWIFVIPVMIFGAITSLYKWQVSGFLTGFICGFIIWFGTNVFYDSTLPGKVFGRVGSMFSLPGIVVIFCSGLVGGILTGIALHAGRNLFIAEALNEDKKFG